MGAAACGQSAGQVDGNHPRIGDVIGLLQELTGQLGPPLADSHSAVGSVAGMGVGDDGHIPGVNHHFTHILVNHRLVRGNENSAGFHAGALRILMHVSVDGPAYGAETVVAVANIKIAVRSVKTEKGLDFMRRAMEECQTLNVERLMRAALSGMPDVIKYLEETPYSGGATALSDSSSAFERWCDNRIIQTIRPQKYNSFTIGPLVAYVLARQNEIKTVRIILTGKLNHLPDDAIRERVREMYV